MDLIPVCPTGQVTIKVSVYPCITCIDTMLYICYSFIVFVIFYSLYAQVPWNFLYACYVK